MKKGVGGEVGEKKDIGNKKDFGEEHGQETKHGFGHGMLNSLMQYDFTYL